MTKIQINLDCTKMRFETTREKHGRIANALHNLAGTIVSDSWQYGENQPLMTGDKNPEQIGTFSIVCE